MSQQLRQLKTRIRSIEGTWKVTRAMEMVSMAKFKSLENPLDMGRLYFEKVQSLFTNLLSVEQDTSNPFLAPRSKGGAVGLCVITSDAGLCGSYNNQILRLVDQFIEKRPDQKVRLYVYGRKGQGHFKKAGVEVDRSFSAIHGRVLGNFHQPILNTILEDYESGEISEAYVAHTVFVNAMKHHFVVEKFLNIEKPTVKPQSFITEFGHEGILSEIIPMYLSSWFRLMMLESLTSEHSARMVSMRSAKDNAKELMGDLILLRNKMRQAMITKEVIEIISSVEALKG